MFSHFDPRNGFCVALKTVPLSICAEASDVQKVEFPHSPILETANFYLFEALGKNDQEDQLGTLGLAVDMIVLWNGNCTCRPKGLLLAPNRRSTQ